MQGQLSSTSPPIAPIMGDPSSHPTGDGQHADWTPDSWRSKPVKQKPEYPDQKALSKSLAELKKLPPIVHPREIARLKQHLRDVARGEAFLLQGGDCAELFDYCEQGAIESKIKLLLQMSLVLIWGADKRVVRIGRMAGQYAKPRSSPMETVDGKQVPSFRGDILNGFALDERELDPNRLVKYAYSIGWALFVPSSLLTPSQGLPPFSRNAQLHQSCHLVWYCRLAPTSRLGPRPRPRPSAQGQVLRGSQLSHRHAPLHAHHRSRQDRETGYGRPLYQPRRPALGVRTVPNPSPGQPLASSVLGQRKGVLQHVGSLPLDR